MLIRLTKIVDDEAVIDEFDNEVIIQACFDSCVPRIQRNVREFLDNKRQQQMTINFEEFKVRLRRKWGQGVGDAAPIKRRKSCEKSSFLS